MDTGTEITTPNSTGGRLDASIPPADLLALVMSIATSWLSAAPAIKELGGRSDPMSRRRLNQHRNALLEAVARVGAPS